jgi:hypothetical protein
MSAPRAKSKPVAARNGSNGGALRNHDAVTVLEPWQPGKNVGASRARVGLKKREARRIEDQFPRRRVARCLPEKLTRLCN